MQNTQLNAKVEQEQILAIVRDEVIRLATILGFSDTRMYVKCTEGAAVIILRTQWKGRSLRFLNWIDERLERDGLWLWRDHTVQAFEIKLNRAVRAASSDDSLGLHWIVAERSDVGCFVLARSEREALHWRAHDTRSDEHNQCELIASLPPFLNKVDDEVFDRVDETMDAGWPSTVVLAAVGGLVVNPGTPRIVWINDQNYVELRHTPAV